MYNSKCGIRKADAEAVLDLFDHYKERHEVHESEVERYVHEKLIWDCSGHHAILYERRYSVIYSPLLLYSEIEAVLVQTTNKKTAFDMFPLIVTPTLVISRRKKVGKRQGRVCSVYDYCRFFLGEDDFIPCCVALRLTGYELKEVHF
jgi:hypothetical protein